MGFRCHPAHSGVKSPFMNPLAYPYDRFSDLFRQRFSRDPAQAAAVYRAYFRAAQPQVESLPPFAGQTELAHQVQRTLGCDLPRLVDRHAQDGVTKLVLKLADGHCIETVILPMPRHVTVCISCQVGCRMGCRFCETGQMGFIRHLRVEEIVAQVYYARVVLGLAVRNVVFMGMGEPLDNWDQVEAAMAVMEDQRGLDIAKRHVTLSTAGILPGIERLAGQHGPQLNLAISLNAPRDALRHWLMPGTQPYTLHELKQVLQAYPLARGRVFFMEYVLIRGVNDTEDHARQTAAWLMGLPVKVNLIAYNPRANSPFEAPLAEDVERFRQILVARRLFVRLRGAKGDAIQAACGQLGRGRG